MLRRKRRCKRCNRKIVFADDREYCGTCQREMNPPPTETELKGPKGDKGDKGDAGPIWFSNHENPQ